MALKRHINDINRPFLVFRMQLTCKQWLPNKLADPLLPSRTFSLPISL